MKRQNIEFDDIDRRILTLLQRDASQSVAALADQVGLTSNPCWRRVKRLEDDGVIERRVAVVSPKALGLGLMAFVTIKTDNHAPEWLTNFASTISRIPEIVECHRMTGDIDYLLKIIARDLRHYDEIYRRFIESVPDLSDVAATFSMEELKDGRLIDPGTARP